MNFAARITSHAWTWLGPLGMLSLSMVPPSVAAEDDWRLALPGWNYEFPRDHSPHDDFKTEWWYFTGNLRDAEGRRFGYQLTFFRQGTRPPTLRTGTSSQLLCDELKFAHFAVSDPATGRFLFRQKTSRGAFGEAGFNEGDRMAWIDDWTLRVQPDQTMVLSGSAEKTSLQLTLRSGKPWVIHGTDGVSQKATGEGHASHYYSGTRLESAGNLISEGREFSVTGTTWFDHEWATNQLTPEQVGWNWFALHFNDGTELMLYQMRLKNGALDPNSSGTFVAKDGATRHLMGTDYVLTPRRWWTSPASKARYPVAWTLSIPNEAIEAEISTPLECQELNLPPIAYWEGMIDVSGTRSRQRIKGEGYMELTGYAGALVGLSDPGAK